MFKPSMLLKSAAAAALFAAAGVALAGSATANVAVSATVTQTCSISTTALAFGTYDPVVANASTALNASSGSISVACTTGSTGVTVGMGQGSNYSGGNRMKGGTSGGFLPYTVYQPPTNTAGAACTYPAATAWTTTGAGLLALTSPTSKTARTYNVCGTIAAGQDVPADPSYTDTVVATVNF